MCKYELHVLIENNEETDIWGLKDVSLETGDLSIAYS